MSQSQKILMGRDEERILFCAFTEERHGSNAQFQVIVNVAVRYAQGICAEFCCYLQFAVGNGAEVAFRACVAFVDKQIFDVAERMQFCIS